MQILPGYPPGYTPDPDLAPGEGDEIEAYLAEERETCLAWIAYMNDDLSDPPADSSNDEPETLNQRVDEVARGAVRDGDRRERGT